MGKKYYVYDKMTGRYLGYDRVSKEIWWLIPQNSGARAELTENEIKELGEFYWGLAVEI